MARLAELDRIADDKDRKRRYLEQRIEEADEQNNQLLETITILSSVLTAGLDQRWVVNFDSLKKPVAFPPFDPKGANVPAKELKLDDFLPPPPGFVSRLFNGQKRYEAEAAQARQAYEQANQKRDEDEAARQQRLAQFETEYATTCALIEGQARKHSDEIEQFRSEYQQGEPRAVSSYYSIVFDHDLLPSGFPTAAKAAYIRESRQLVIERELPTIEIVPAVSAYRYVRARDAIESTSRAVSLRNSLYASLVSQVALRTLQGAFAADSAQIIDSVVLNCFVDTIDAATGHSISPYLLTVRVANQTFGGFDLSRVEPIACLKALKAQVSRSPAELVPVRPLVDFNMVDKRFIEATDVLSALDQRPNLMELTPGEFENLITNLFTKMGLETKLTQASRDGGVDCVAWDMRPIVGGKVIVQAKRYKNTVGVSAVRDLYGTVMNEGAAKGILVTTSGYGKSAFDFIEHKPLELVSGSHLLYLLEEHTGVKARIEAPEDWVDPQADLLSDEPRIDVAVAAKAIRPAMPAEVNTSA